MSNLANTRHPSRRAILAGAPTAAIGIGALSAAALCETSADPIFAAISSHAAAREAHTAQCIATDEVLATRASRLIRDEDLASLKELDRREQEAFYHFAETVPTTLVGLRAAIEHFNKYADELSDLVGPFLATLLKSPALRAA